MKAVRNLMFSLICVTAFVALQAHVAAQQYWDWYTDPRPTTANSCDVTENAGDIVYYGEHNWECPYVRYEGSCNWEVGCLDALVAAQEVCSWWGSKTGHDYLVIAFDCTDPMDPPTDFTFECDPWFPQQCYIPG